MKALVLTSPNEFSVEDVAVPGLGDFEVLCRVESVGICGTDIHMIRGDYPDLWPGYYPFIPGHEWSGEVVELGSGAERFGFALGDRVAGTSHAPCGYCTNCMGGRYNLCSNYGVADLHSHYGHTAQGCYAEYVVHSIRSVFKIPSTLSYDEAALADPASIALHTAKRGGVADGAVVVVIGAGPVGLLAAECARALGASQVFLGARGARVEVAEKLGYDVLDFGLPDPVRRFRSSNPDGADVVLDAAGVPNTIRASLELLARGGRCAAVGIPTEDVHLDVARLVLDELELVGVRAASGEMAPALDMMADGRVRAKELITHRFPLSGFAEAVETLTRRENGAIKVLIHPSAV